MCSVLTGSLGMAGSGVLVSIKELGNGIPLAH